MKTKLNVNSIISSIRAALPEDKSEFALHEPCFNGNEWEYVKECLDTNWVSSVGKYVDLFEKKLAEFTGVKYAVAVVNGTAALHICLKLAGVTEKNEVLIPSLTFVATANAVTYLGAIPHFIDSEYKTLGLDPYKLEQYLSEIAVIKDGKCYNQKTGNIIKAVVPMHTFGHPVDMDKLVEVCHRFKLELIEDAAEALGSYYKNKHMGNWGRLSSLSFNGNKIITTGGGGAILTNDHNLAKIAKHITTTAKRPHKWEFYHDMIAYNYRMPNINAALGCAQLEQLDNFLNRKRQLAKRYDTNLKNIEGIKFFTEPDFAKSNYWLNAILLDEKYSGERDAILQETNNCGLMTRPAWTLMHELPMFKASPKMDLTVAEDLAKRIINIPSSVFNIS